MSKLLGTALIVGAAVLMASQAHAATANCWPWPVPVPPPHGSCPEIDPASLAAVIPLVLGGLALMTGRRKAK